MRRIALIAAGLIVATVLVVVVNYVTSGGPWRLWLVLAALVIPAAVIEMARERGRRPAAGYTQEIGVSRAAQVGRKGSVLRSPQLIRLSRRG